MVRLLLVQRRHLHAGGNGRPQISNEKKKLIRPYSMNDCRMSIRVAATRAGLHHTPIWRFLNQKLKHYPEHGPGRQEDNDSGKQNRIWLTKDCWKELRTEIELFKKCYFLLSVNIHYLDLSLSRISSIGFETSEWSWSSSKQWALC